ncbi:MAG: site-specific integrase [Fuerstiella sp.]
MASVHKTANGYRVHFRDRNGKQKAISLAGHTKRQVEEVSRNIEDIVNSQIVNDAPPQRTQKWLVGISDKLRLRLEKHGLVEPAAQADSKVHGFVEFVELYIAKGRTRDGRQAAEKTLEKWRTTLNTIRDFFGYAALEDINAAKTHEYRVWLEKHKSFKPNTYRKHIQNCKLFFNGAIREEIVSNNPFRDIPSGSVKNRERDYFLTGADTEKIIAAAPDSMWRLIIALCRYGGLRCPSEVVDLKWDDVLWDQSKVIVNSSKTEHHEGHESRVIPMFPELKPHLEMAWDDAPDGATKAVQRKSRDSNLRTTLTKIILRAGLKPWPKLFHNMRASRETELLTSGDYPAHVVAEWIGHSVTIQNKHYAQVTDDHFQKASGVVTDPKTVTQTVTRLLEKAGQEQTDIAEIVEKLRLSGLLADT